MARSLRNLRLIDRNVKCRTTVSFFVFVAMFNVGCWEGYETVWVPLFTSVLFLARTGSRIMDSDFFGVISLFLCWKGVTILRLRLAAPLFCMLDKYMIRT